MVTLTERAAQEVKTTLEEQGKPAASLRVFVAGGGCSGLQYGLAIEESPDSTDQIFEQFGVKLVVDPRSYVYVQGANVDFVDDVMGGGFKVDNPNATRSCGCGSSFQTEDGQGGGGCSSCH
ncbi:MAG TPA: iron-sulfur cluster insertion protein ErpA [Armatimonadota bacterium]|jgi:iron-sulfur cluster assembly protein